MLAQGRQCIDHGTLQGNLGFQPIGQRIAHMGKFSGGGGRCIDYFPLPVQVGHQVGSQLFIS